MHVYSHILGIFYSSSFYLSDSIPSSTPQFNPFLLHYFFLILNTTAFFIQTLESPA